MQQKHAHELFKPIKPSSVKTEGEKSEAWNEYRVEREAIREQMVRQREARLSATAAFKKKNAG